MKELMKLKIWIGWKYEKRDNGSMTKVPYSAITGKPCGVSPDWRNKWVCYNEAKQAVEQYGFNGIGFVLPEGYFLLDLDEMLPGDPFADSILRRFCTYSETSVSGAGTHAIGKCDISRLPIVKNEKGERKLDPKYYKNNRSIDVELYIGGLTSRFATYSGNAISDVPIQDCTEAILATLEQNMLKPDEQTAEGDDAPEQPEMTEEEIEEAAFDIVTRLRRAKNSAKFIRLYDEGDTSGYPSDSEADLALCDLVAFLAGNNPPLIEAIVRSSKLYRDKWDSHPTYLKDTIEKAITKCVKTKERPYFIYVNQKGKEILDPPLLAKYIRETVPFILVRDNGKQATLVFVYKDGCYQLHSRDMMLGVIKAPVEAYKETLVVMSKIVETYNLLMTDLKHVRQDELNADEHLINFQNGLLKVNSEELTLLPHTPKVLSTIQIPCKWTGKEIPTPVFDSYMERLINGDPAITHLILEFIGMCISNVKGWRTKKALFIHGKGDTGKSVLKSLTEKILGPDNFASIDLQQIEARFGTSTIYGTRLAGCSDMSFMTVGELKKFKMITGGDRLFAEFKGQQSFHFTYSGLLWFCMNHLPKFGGDDGKWVYNRMIIVNCPNVIPSEKQDKELLDKLYEEREGIIFKAVQALQTVMRNGYRFSEPESVQQERLEYMQENNSAIGFFNECMCLLTSKDRASHRATTSEVYRAYRDWCRDNNNGYAKTMKEFRDTIADHLGITIDELITHGSRGSVFRNYTLTNQANSAYNDFLAS